MRYWVFTIGTRDHAPPVNWLEGWDWHVNEMWFPSTKRPVSVRAGDRAVIYGSHGRGFIAAVEVTSDQPEPNPRSKEARFPWIVKYRLLVSKAADKNVASPDDAGLNPRRVVRGPHTAITAEEYERAVRVMLDAAARTAAP